MSVLERTLSDVHRGGVVVSAFEPGVDRPTSEAVRCRNGLQYGIGVLVRLRSPHRGYTTDGAVYSIQDTADPEERVWLCLHAIGQVHACTTHLASTSPSVALSQCQHLLNTVIPSLRALGQDGVILGADLNLRHGHAPDVQSCLPIGLVSADDGGQQYVVASTDFTVTSARSVGMHGTTDHPGLVADLTSP